jgi:hypothetical protein
MFRHVLFSSSSQQFPDEHLIQMPAVQVHGIAPWPLEAGAEIVHGEGSEVASLLRDALHMQLTEREYPNYVFWHAGGVIEYVGKQSPVTHPVVKEVYDILDEVPPLTCLDTLVILKAPGYVDNISVRTCP